MGYPSNGPVVVAWSNILVPPLKDWMLIKFTAKHASAGSLPYHFGLLLTVASTNKCSKRLNNFTKCWCFSNNFLCFIWKELSRDNLFCIILPNFPWQAPNFPCISLQTGFVRNSLYSSSSVGVWRNGTRRVLNNECSASADRAVVGVIQKGTAGYQPIQVVEGVGEGKVWWHLNSKRKPESQHWDIPRH